MKLLSSLFAIALISGIAVGSPAQAQVNNHFHPAVVIPAACGVEYGQQSYWTVVDGHHVLYMTNIAGEPGFGGFEVLGNVQAVEHNILPSTNPGKGPLTPGWFSFQVASVGPSGAEPYFSYLVASSTDYIMNSGSTQIDPKGTQYIHVPAGSSATGYPCEIQVVLFCDNGLDVRATVGNFVYNGVPITGSATVRDFDQSTPGSFCSNNE